jgi:hypothetical protein
MNMILLVAVQEAAIKFPEVSECATKTAVMPPLLCKTHIWSDVKNFNILHSVPYDRQELTQRIVIGDESNLPLICFCDIPYFTDYKTHLNF